MNPRYELASRLSSLPSGFVSLADLTAAAALVMQSRNVMQKPTGIEGEHFTDAGFRYEYDPTESHGTTNARGYQNPRWTMAESVAALPGPGGVQIHISRMDALEFVRSLTMGPDDILIADPDYKGTSGYAHSSARDAVLEICDRGHRAGALVILHEAVGLAKELGKGWQDRPASPLRARGSSFWKDGEEREVITFNRPVVYWPAQQVSMF